MRPKTAYPKNCILSTTIDFIPNNEETTRVTDLPGPGKYETLDMLGSGTDFYNTKYKTQKQKSFNGGERFSKGK